MNSEQPTQNKGAWALGKVIKSPDQILREIINKFPENLDNDDLVAALNEAFETYEFDQFITFIEAGISEHFPDTIAIQMVVWDEKDVHLIEIAKLRAMIKE